MAIDHPKRMLYFGPNAGFELFRLVNQGIGFISLSNAWRLPGRMANMPDDVSFGIRALFNSLVARLSASNLLTVSFQSISQLDIPCIDVFIINTG